MKKLYNVPLIEVIQLLVADDIICTSGELNPKEWTEENEKTVDFGQWKN